MGQKVENVNPIISINIPNAKAALDDAEPKTIINIKKRRNGAKIFFKVALFVMRGRSRKPKVPIPVDNDSRSSIWRKLVGSMRPMHLQSNNLHQSPPQNITTSTNNNGGGGGHNLNENASNNNIHDQGEDGFESASEFANSPSPVCSRYASAVGLNEMVEDESSRFASTVGLNEMVKEDEDEDDDDDDGDDMIDAKADEFIFQFYQQMKLQRMDIVDRRYKEMSMRSLGI